MPSSVSDSRSQVPVDDLLQLLQTANTFADGSHSIIAAVIHSGLEVENKADRTLVTKADIEIERFIRDQVADLYPSHGVIGEEFGSSRSDADFQWVVDPIDGTEEFVHGFPTFGSMIGLHYKSLPILGVIDHCALGLRIDGAFGHGARKNGVEVRSLEHAVKPRSELRLGICTPKMFLRYKDERSIFTQLVNEFPSIIVLNACYSFSAAVLGSLDAVIEYNLKIWDFGAVQAILPEVGGKFVVLHERASGMNFPYISAVFGKPWAVDEVLSVLKTAS